MDKITLEEVLKAVHGELLNSGSKIEFDKVCTDSRKVSKGDIFFALRGERFNGNDFAQNAINKGASICIVDEEKLNLENINKDTSIIKVKNTNRALMDLAKYYRSRLNIKVIGITGSTGKTSTKDLTAAALSSKYKVFKTEGNFNNEIGLPMMIFKLDKTYDIAVLEMGMSNFGEIHNLADIARPDIAIITNIGVSHIEFLKTRENILKAKIEITDFFNENSTLIINNDNDILNSYTNEKFNVVSIGTMDYEDFKGENIILHELSIEYDILEKITKDMKHIKLNIPGKHNVLNSLQALACARIFNLPYEEIEKGMMNFQATSMRLDIQKTENITIINDCYNASPDSMIAAIDVLKTIKGNRNIAILGTMKELGEEAYKAHYDVGKYAFEKNIDLLIALGEYSKAYKEGFNNNKSFEEFTNLEELNNYLKDNIKQNDVILVKASRTMKFENVVNELENINN
jgi:UDP-N-acetylmuramoyl-tripeptide--D-alanyl-D-alanine ligase